MKVTSSIENPHASAFAEVTVIFIKPLPANVNNIAPPSLVEASDLRNRIAYVIGNGITPRIIIVQKQQAEVSGPATRT